MKIEYVKIDTIKPYKNNAKEHPEEQIEQIKASIQEFGNNDPIAIWKDEIVEGHGRYIALKELEFDKIPIIRLDHLTDEERKAYTLVHNKLTMNSGFDMDILSKELESLTNIDMSEFGFEDELSMDIQTEVLEDDYNIEENIPVELKAKLGDIYQLGNHRLMCGDSTSIDDVNKLINGIKVDMVFTDPPYGMNLDTDFSGMKSKIFKGGNGGNYDEGIVDTFTPEMLKTIFDLNIKETFIWGANYFAELIPNRNKGSWIVWDKRSNDTDDVEADYSSDKMYGSCFELCWSKNKHKQDIARIKWAGMFGMEKQDTKTRVHPTQKPIALCEWFISKYTKIENIILDLFGGSGSTLIACEQLGRKCYMMEYDAKYVDVIIDRWEQFTGKKAIKIN